MIYSILNITNLIMSASGCNLCNKDYYYYYTIRDSEMYFSTNYPKTKLLWCIANNKKLFMM